ncbi:hypothetical protein CBR61_15305 [Porphyrobacter sp. CACIAM 03H1]|nr:hypothetical protein CBR61_15305 [Porphyrobacter sp. CACIAM 03H1]
MINDLHRAAQSSGSYAAVNDSSYADDACLEAAKMLQAQRQKRFSYFSNRAMFTDLCWDILLCLFIGDAEARSASLGELSGAANCSPSTALRWLNVLVEEGIVRIVNHSEHVPEIGVALSAQGHSTMRRYLIDVATDSAPAMQP